MRASITYDRYTEESVSNGDTSDNGWYHPRGWVSLNRGEKHRQKVIRNAQCGRYDWDFREAVEAILEFGVTDVSCTSERIGPNYWKQRICVTSEARQRDETDQYTEGYALWLEGLSEGTAERLRAFFIRHGASEVM